MINKTTRVMPNKRRISRKLCLPSWRVWVPTGCVPCARTLSTDIYATTTQFKGQIGSAIHSKWKKPTWTFVLATCNLRRPRSRTSSTTMAKNTARSILPSRITCQNRPNLSRNRINSMVNCSWISVRAQACLMSICRIRRIQSATETTQTQFKLLIIMATVHRAVVAASNRRGSTTAHLAPTQSRHRRAETALAISAKWTKRNKVTGKLI